MRLWARDRHRDSKQAHSFFFCCYLLLFSGRCGIKETQNQDKINANKWEIFFVILSANAGLRFFFLEEDKHCNQHYCPPPSVGELSTEQAWRL